MGQPLYDVFFIIGAIIILGFITSQIFERTKFSNVILLMSAGMLLGPVLKIVRTEGPISVLAPYIGTLALIIILFEGGLNLNLFKVLTSLAKASGFAVLVISLSMVFLGILMHLIFGWTYLEGLLLGAVLGGTSEAIVIPFISKLTMNEDSKVILTLESTLTNPLCVIVALALIEIISTGTVNLRNTASSLASAFSIGMVVAAIFAIFWIGIINKLYMKQVGYSMTIAMVFILYSFVEAIGGNGATAILVFALLLGNFNELAKRLNLKGEFALDTTLRAFHGEVSFFVRTFFFIFVGLMFFIEALNSKALIMALAVFIVLIIARILGIKALIMTDKTIVPFKKSILSMMPRGLSAAVLSLMTLSAGIQIPYFAEIVFSIIILTNLTTTFSVFIIERKKLHGVL